MHGLPEDLLKTIIYGIGVVASLVLGTLTAVVIEMFVTKKWSWGIWLLSIIAWLVTLNLLLQLSDWYYRSFVRAW